MDVILLTGPPEDSSRDEEWLIRFLGLPGKRIVAGGTTASLLSRYTGGEVVIRLDSQRPEIPPWGRMAGVELVTEGVITLEAVVNGWNKKEESVKGCEREPSAADKMSDLLKQADTDFLLTGLGPRRRELIVRLSRLLRSEGKKVIINRF